MCFEQSHQGRLEHRFIFTCSLRTSEPQRQGRVVRSRTLTQASAVEVFQLADEGSLIAGTAAVLFACTLVVSASSLQLPHRFVAEGHAVFRTPT